MALEITQAKQKNSKKSRREYYLLQMYDVMKVGDQQHVIKKVKEKNDPLIYVIPEEELFERLLDIHISCGHGSRDKMINIVQQKYFIPRPCVEMFLKACKYCQTKKNKIVSKIVVKPITSKDFMTRGQVDLIDFQSIPDGEYKWLLNYQDHSTKYVCLRPLRSKHAVNVAEELLKIFLQFGAPSILQSDNGREFANKIVEELKILWPQLLIVHGRPRHPQSQGSVERSNQDVENILRSWMTDNKSTRWSVGCYFTQWQKNNLLHRVIGRTPYKAVFGHDPKFGLKSTNLPPTILSNITTEEELENQEKEMGVFREEEHEQRCEEPVTEATKELGIELEENELDTNEKIQNVDSISSDNMDCGIVELQMATKDDVVICPVCQSAVIDPCQICEKCKVLIHISCATDDKLCNLCTTEQLIQLQREKCYEGQKRQAEDMASTSKKWLPDIDVGDCVLLNIDPVDRSPGDPPNLLTVVTDKRNGVYQVGTVNGIIKSWFSRPDLNIATSKFILHTQVDKTKFLSIREAVSLESLFQGQGFVKCSCQPSKIQCKTNRCVCFKGKKQCNSRCHKSGSCANK